MPCARAERASIFSRISSNVGTSSPTVARELRHRLVHLLLHLRLVELREQALTLAQLLLERHRVLLHRALGRVGVLRGFEQHRPQALDLALERDEPVRERLRGLPGTASDFSVSPLVVASSVSSSAWRAFPVTLSSSS